MNFRFSVAMCVYIKDNAEWFKTAVDSVLNQTIPPSEVVVVADGPLTESLDKILGEYERGGKVKVIRFSENRGHGEARRASFEACENELIAIMDADDISLPDRFNKQLLLFEKDSSLDVAGGNIAEFIDEPDNVVGRRVVPEKDSDIKKYMKKRCPMNLVTVMFKKSSVEKAGGFIDWYCEEDYYLWLRMAKKNMIFANVADELVKVRVGEDMYRRRGGWRYFKSEAKLQKYMYKNNFINFFTLCGNVIKRFIVQVVLPNKVRGWVFRKFARQR